VCERRQGRKTDGVGASLGYGSVLDQRSIPAMSLARSIALATDRLVEPVEGMHRSISGRWFRALGSIGRPIRPAHDAIARLVYHSIRLTGAVAGAGFEARTGADHPGADRAVAVVNGLWGGDGADLPMTLRDADGAPIDVEADLAAAFRNPTDRIVVLVHGLMETERVWAGSTDHPGLYSRLQRHPEFTPVAVRYPTGRSVDANGAGLAMILEQLVDRWPVPVRSVAMVGNSMGGLVSRRAGEVGRADRHRWVASLSEIVTLGTPHLGTPLEKLANVAACSLDITATTRPLAGFLNRRSRGIKDLRYGAIADVDWGGRPVDALLTDTVRRDPLPKGTRHHFIAGTVTRSPHHPIAEGLGDLVVRAASGTGRRRMRPDTTTVLGGVTHFSLSDHPAALDTVVNRLEAGT
jgi:hypothetical protein